MWFLVVWLWTVPVCFIFCAYMLFKLDRTLVEQIRKAEAEEQEGRQ